MKSYKHLWERLVSDENIIHAIKISAKNKRKHNKRHRMLKKYAEDPESHIQEIRDILEYFEPNDEPHIKTINDGISAKQRQIIVPTYLEVIVYNAVANILRKIFVPHFYEHSYASIPKRGTHKCLHRVEKWVRNKRLYVWKLDIRGFFRHISRRTLSKKLRRVINDKRFYELLITIIWSTPRNLGLPLGFPTSQWLANLYLTEIDFFIAHHPGVYKFARFMDDMAIFAKSKTDISELRYTLHRRLLAINLEIKHGTRVFPLRGSLFLDFLGYRIYRNHTTLRRRLALKIARKVRRIHKQTKVNIHSARQMVTYLGYFKHVQCYGFFIRRIQPMISPSRLRAYISTKDRELPQPA